MDKKKDKFMIPNEYGLPVQSMGDVIDKMSILTRKINFGEEDAIEELQYLEKCMDDCGVKVQLDGKLISALIRVVQANYDIWSLENELRHGDTTKMEVEEIGKRAIKIRDFNKRRVKYKNLINQLTGLGFVEFKIKHRSQ